MSSKTSTKSTPASQKAAAAAKPSKPAKAKAVVDVPDQEPDVPDADPDAEVVEDPEVEEVSEVSETKPAKPTKAGAKPPAKTAAKPTKAGAKSTGKTAPKTGTKAATGKPGAKKAASKGPSEESKRYDTAFNAAVQASYVTLFPALKPRTVHDKCANVVGMYILETINQLQQNEVVDEHSYNPYPADKFILLEDKLGKATTGKTVKTAGSTEKPSKLRLPLKRGQRRVEDAVSEHGSEQAEVEPAEAEDEKENEPADEPAEETTEQTEEKKTVRKNVVSFNRNSKTYLGFILTRFVDEIYSTDDALKEDFTKFVMTKISKDVDSQLSRAVVSTVDRLGRRVASMPDHNFEKEVSNRFKEYFADRPGVWRPISEYLMKYFQLIGVAIGTELWLSHKAINGQTIEKAMRMLNLGNYEYMVDNKYVVDQESDYGLEHGVLEHARGFDNLLNPPPTKAQQEERAAKRAKAAADRAAGIVPEKAPKSRGKKAKAVEEAPADDAEEAEEDAENEAEDDAGEGDAVEAEEEAEPEPEPEPKAKGKKLKKIGS